jgi:hypothetical protein
VRASLRPNAVLLPALDTDYSRVHRSTAPSNRTTMEIFCCCRSAFLLCVGSCRTTCDSDEANPPTNRRDKVVDNDNAETNLSATMTGSLASRALASRALASRALQRPRNLGSLISRRNQQSRVPRYYNCMHTVGTKRIINVCIL